MEGSCIASSATTSLIWSPGRTDWRGGRALRERARLAITERDDADRETASTAQKLICLADGSYIEHPRHPRRRGPTTPSFRDLPGPGRTAGPTRRSTPTTFPQSRGAAPSIRPALPPGPVAHERRLGSGEASWGRRLVLPASGQAIGPALRDRGHRRPRLPHSSGENHPRQRRDRDSWHDGVGAKSRARRSGSRRCSAPRRSRPRRRASRCRVGRVGQQWLVVIGPGEAEGLVSVALGTGRGR